MELDPSDPRHPDNEPWEWGFALLVVAIGIMAGIALRLGLATAAALRDTAQ